MEQNILQSVNNILQQKPLRFLR